MTRREFASDQEVRWCPGCGDYAVLSAVQGLLPELGVRREDLVFVSGIGCSSRFPYYLSCYGMHSIHGRAPAIATGLAVSRPDLDVWVVTGDGDGLSIGTGHLLHALRRNVDLTVLLFNNEVYALTKGQCSPTSRLGTLTVSTPSGSAVPPFNPVALALAAGAGFVARTLDSDRAHLTEVLRSAAAHRGSSFVEIYQNCHVFNDGAFAALKDPAGRESATLHLRQGEPLRYGGGAVRVAAHGGVELCAADDPGVLRWDAAAPDAAPACAVAQLVTPTALGVFRDVDRPVFGRRHTKAGPGRVVGADDLDVLLAGRDGWEVPGGRARPQDAGP